MMFLSTVNGSLFQTDKRCQSLYRCVPGSNSTWKFTSESGQNTCLVNAAYLGIQRTSSVVTRGCLYFRMSGPPLPRFLPHAGLNTELRLSYERIFVNSRSNCYFSTEANQMFYTTPCKSCTGFTETYRVARGAVFSSVFGR